MLAEGGSMLKSRYSKGNGESAVCLGDGLVAVSSHAEASCERDMMGMRR